MANRYRGEVEFWLGGRRTVLAYDWAAIARLRDQVGADFDLRLSNALGTVNLELLATVIEIGLQRHDGDVTVAMILKESPPIAAAFDAVRRALTLAFQGVEEAPVEPGPRPPRGRWLARLSAAIPLFGRAARR